MARGEKREQGRKEGRKGGRRDEKTGERILRESQERKGVEERERESGEKGDRNFSSCRKNVRALCARIGATSFLFPSLSLSLFRERAEVPRLEKTWRGRKFGIFVPAFFTFLSCCARVVPAILMPDDEPLSFSFSLSLSVDETVKLSACMHAAGTMGLRSSR